MEYDNASPFLAIHFPDYIFATAPTSPSGGAGGCEREMMTSVTRSLASNPAFPCLTPGIAGSWTIGIIAPIETWRLLLFFVVSVTEL
jgi:hypothetical protein